MITVEIKHVSKTFGPHVVFKCLNYVFEPNNIYALAGINGSGKSTLSKIIAGLLAPTSGEVIYTQNNSVLSYSLVQNRIGFSAPYINLFDEFSAYENLKIVSEIRNHKLSDNDILQNLEDFKLIRYKDKPLKELSSGMKQKMKLIFSVIHNPDIIIFDEPTSNLDDSSKDFFYHKLKQLNYNKTIIIASNEKTDLEHCNKFLNL